MKHTLQVLALATSLVFLCGCVATVPIKVAAKTTKLGVKTATTGVKATAKVAGAAIPNGDSDEEEE
ncbi:hypothetical protein [Pelagicoccus sp. SDUM812002]|uniref:hypothetical protein n=1 Tax=Pelagicoccus sp. SDUM812002 TaxID=3041266 RepID=UPI00280F29AD|nr:hypothetical protein [Pelagicoccus sp. SDUM812002]MDQ8186310.1 hypothetical protein [Pelagicoccus sp. SDUM812002]